MQCDVFRLSRKIPKRFQGVAWVTKPQDVARSSRSAPLGRPFWQPGSEGTRVTTPQTPTSGTQGTGPDPMPGGGQGLPSFAQKRQRPRATVRKNKNKIKNHRSGFQSRWVHRSGHMAQERIDSTHVFRIIGGHPPMELGPYLRISRPRGSVPRVHGREAVAGIQVTLGLAKTENRNRAPRDTASGEIRRVQNTVVAVNQAYSTTQPWEFGVKGMVFICSACNLSGIHRKNMGSHLPNVCLRTHVPRSGLAKEQATTFIY